MSDRRGVTGDEVREYARTHGLPVDTASFHFSAWLVGYRVRGFGRLVASKLRGRG